MFSYLREILYNAEWTKWQRRLDTRLTSHISTCPSEIATYLIYLREHGRLQREQMAMSSVFNYRDTIRDIHDENNDILKRLEHVLDTTNPCHHIVQLYPNVTSKQKRDT